MKVRCIANSGMSLSKKSIDAGCLKSTIYCIDVGQDYTVYGVSVFRDTINYLVTEIPMWCPAELFEIVNPVLPTLWYCDFRGYEDPFVRELVYGYKEIALDTQYNIDLLECEKYALDIFRMRKKEIDEFEQLFETKKLVISRVRGFNES